MKKIVAVVMCIVMSLAFFGCSAGKSPGSSAENGADSGSGKVPQPDGDAQISLSDMIKDICDGVELPAYDVFELDKSIFEAYSFVKWTDGIEAVCAEGQISTLPHSLVLIRMNGGDAGAMAASIAEKANLAKWVCVSAEAGNVLYTDDYVLMVMSYKNSVDGIKANFEGMVGADNMKTLEIKASGI